MRQLLLTSLVVVVTALPARAGDGCPSSLKHRSPEQVLEDHRTALAAGDWVAVGCDYAEDAVVIHDGGVTHGRAAIVADLQFIASLIGNAVPMVVSEVAVSILNGEHKHMVRLLFTVSTPCLDIPDGVDTYIIKKGKIHAQTAHGFPVFKCFPPS